MKCIRKTVDDVDQVRRVSDDAAARMVGHEGWHYVSRSVWKRAGRPRSVLRRARRTRR